MFPANHVVKIYVIVIEAVEKNTARRVYIYNLWVPSIVYTGGSLCLNAGGFNVCF